MHENNNNNNNSNNSNSDNSHDATISGHCNSRPLNNQDYIADERKYK